MEGTSTGHVDVNDPSFFSVTCPGKVKSKPSFVKSQLAELREDLEEPGEIQKLKLVLVNLSVSREFLCTSN